CRVPWRLALDFLLSGDVRAQAAVQRINRFIRAKTGEDPARVRDGYHLDGTELHPDSDSVAAFVAPFGVAAMVDAENQKWLDAVYTAVVARPLDAEDYFGNTLKLLALFAMSGNTWSPAQ